VNHKYIIIHWRDCTHYDDAAMEPADIASEQLIEMTDVGILVTENKTFIAIASEFMDNPPRYRHISWIPKCNVISRKLLLHK
jgi:hypothetical protein